MASANTSVSDSANANTSTRSRSNALRDYYFMKPANSFTAPGEASVDFEEPISTSYIQRNLKDLTIDEIIEKMTVRTDFPEYLVYNLLINNYNIHLDKIIANANNPTSLDFKLEFNYVDEKQPTPVIVGKIKDFKDINKTLEKDPTFLQDYLRTTFLNQIFKYGGDFDREKFYLKQMHKILAISEDKDFKGIDLINKIKLANNFLQICFGKDEFPDLIDEDLNIPLINLNKQDVKLLFGGEDNELITNPKLQKIINALYLIHQSYRMLCNKNFTIQEEHERQPLIYIKQKNNHPLLIFDSTSKLVSLALYLEDNIQTDTGLYPLSKGIIILSVNINSKDNDGKIAYIPLYNSTYMDPLNDLISIPSANDNNKIAKHFIKNYSIYYNLLLKKIINLSNNVNIFENLSDKKIANYIKINKDYKIVGISIENINKWNTLLKIANYSMETSAMQLDSIENTLIAIFTQLIKFVENKNILMCIPLSVNIFISKSKFLSLISNSSLPRLIIERITDINFLDIIQINNFQLRLYKLTEGKYQEFIHNLDSKANIPEIPNNINFNFIITLDEGTHTQPNMEDTLSYSEYEQICSIANGIHEFMTRYISVHIPFSSYHTRDMLIASLFSNLIYGNSTQQNIIWKNVPSKLFKDSNLDKVFMYSLLNNIAIKCLQSPRNKAQNTEILSFLDEFLKKRNSNINLKIFKQMKPYEDDSKKCTYICEVLLKEDINIETEFMQTDYFDKDYNIFEACGINLHLYRMALEHQPVDTSVLPDRHNIAAAVSSVMSNHAHNLNKLDGGFYRKKYRTKNYITNNKKSKNIKGNKITTKYSQIKRYKYKKTSKI